MELLQNESLIIRSDSDTVTLTTHRIRYQDNRNLNSIMLNQISSIDITYTSKPIFILGAIVLSVIGIYMMNEVGGVDVAFFVAAAISMLIFFTSRKHVIAVSSSSSKILSHTKGMDKKAVQNFVTKVEQAIDNYRRS